MDTIKSSLKVGSYAIIILAAGSSSRLGRPKQLLNFAGKTLLQHSINCAKASGANEVILVLGSSKQLIEDKIDVGGIIVVENLDWDLGISTSIKHGINALESILPKADAAILITCDQPHLTIDVLESLLMEQASTGYPIVGSSYDNTQGIPVLFHRSIFKELLMLSGDSGAKKLFKKYEHLTSFAPFKNGGIDIDTSEDYENLTK